MGLILGNSGNDASTMCDVPVEIQHEQLCIPRGALKCTSIVLEERTRVPREAEAVGQRGARTQAVCALVGRTEPE